jgi:hypothetical protein
MVIVMNVQGSTMEITAHAAARRPDGADRGPSPAESIVALALRVRGEYAEMPGLRLTVPQAARLFGVAPDVARAVLERLRQASVLTCSDRGMYALSR